MKIPVLVPFLAAAVLFSGCAAVPKAPPSDTYYVMAGGSDRNDGLSEQTPFRSLFKAVVMAANSPVKIITVIGTLDASSEQSSHPERVFLIQGGGAEQILIRGANPAGRTGVSTGGAVLSAAGSGRRTVLVRGPVKVRFEGIEISGGRASGEGGGIGIGPGSSVTLGPGSVLRDNNSDNLGGGAVVAPGGTLYLEGGLVSGNRSSLVGGGIAVAGTSGSLVIRNGEISGNHSQGGGGVAVYEGGQCTLSGGVVQNNTADMAGGGVMVNRGAAFTMEGGFIRGNRSSGVGGGLVLLENGNFALKGGEITGNQAAEHGGGIAADNTCSLTIQGGFIAANRAAERGGGVFTAGSLVKTGGKIYGGDVPGDQANAASSGAAIFVFRGEGKNKIRETSASEALILDSSSDMGWVLEDSGES
ncbi:MAG: right-handed parallel beta-helix repeat-containing protein [Treponema sp.]|jgi:predicted outer membrane repeat protein|nr:right-handed parallel beta-helix repeat-containing protein [Treponema sp.]